MTIALVSVVSMLLAETPRDDAPALLDKARAALGGVEKLTSVRSFWAAGSLETSWGGRSAKADIELHFLLPDRFLRKQTVKAYRGRDRTIVTVLNGNDAWADMVPRPPRGQLMGESALFSEGPEPVDVGFAKAEFGRLALALLLALPESLKGQFTRGADLDVGGRPAVIVNVSGSEGFDVSLYLARDSSSPLKLDYVGWTPSPPEAGASRMPSWISIPTSIPLPIRGGGRIAIPTPIRPSLEPGEIPLEVIIQERFSEYRQVSGIQIAHRILRLADQKVFAELTLKSVAIDPVLDPAEFDRK